MRSASKWLFCSLLIAVLPAQAAASPLAAKLDELCQPLVTADLVTGLVVGVLDGDTTLVRGYGKVARGGKAVPDGDTIYEIGSNSKVFTGLLLADAVQRGLVKLDDPVQKYLPEGIEMPKWEDTPVLLWHLSTHTSGLPRLPDMKGGDPADPYAHFDAERLFGALGKVRVRWEPGSKYEYSNLAVGLLGQILVRVEQAPSFAALLQLRITGPLQMKATGVLLDAAQTARLAPPYDADGEPAHTWDLAALAGAGGIRSSMHDMLRWAQLQRAPGDSPLAAAVRLSQQQHHEGTNGIAMGLNWHFARDGQTLWHNGQTGGYHSYVAVVPAGNRAVCVLANASRGEFDAIGERILQHLYGQATKPLAIEAPAVVDRAVLQRYVGTYRMGIGSKFTITLRERGLFAQLTSQVALRLLPRSPTEFFYRAVAASITFELDGETVQALVLHQDGNHTRCERLEPPK